METDPLTQDMPMSIQQTNQCHSNSPGHKTTKKIENKAITSKEDAQKGNPSNAHKEAKDKPTQKTGEAIKKNK